eukprot:COSAG01_NODE_9754_length_2352_cov_3.522858_2_plen_235_part_00
MAPRHQLSPAYLSSPAPTPAVAWDFPPCNVCSGYEIEEWNGLRLGGSRLGVRHLKREEPQLRQRSAGEAAKGGDELAAAAAAAALPDYSLPQWEAYAQADDEVAIDAATALDALSRSLRCSHSPPRLRTLVHLPRHSPPLIVVEHWEPPINALAGSPLAAAALSHNLSSHICHILYISICHAPICGRGNLSPPPAAVAAMARSRARDEAELRGRTSLCIIPGYRFRLCDGAFVV